MEGVIATFFDSVFTDLERDSLGARYKRRGISDYLSSVVAANSDDIQENCGQAVKAACRIHAEAKEKNGSICPLGKFHNVLYVAAKLSYDWKLTDPKINAILLNQIFSCEQTFERIVIAGILGPFVTRILSGWQADFLDERECLNALDFFLNHSVSEKMSYNVIATHENLFMVNVPMPAYHNALPAHLACVMDRPAALLLLLRYGARIGHKEHGEWEDGMMSPALMQQILRLGEAMTRDGIVPENALECIKIIMRAVPFVALNDETLREYAELLLPKSRWCNPPELKHMARCAVRKQLCKDSGLPKGIFQLPVPATLYPYLDLQED
jgi:ankyrin repeat/SOCS box protein 17